LFATVRALPCDTVTCHAPLVFVHAVLAYGKTASAIIAEHKRASATMAFFDFFSPSLVSPGNLVLSHSIYVDSIF